MGTSPSSILTTPGPNTSPKYGPFDDKFMFKYLSRLLASIQPVPVLFKALNATMVPITYTTDSSDLELMEYLENERKITEGMNSMVIDPVQSTSPTSGQIQDLSRSNSTCGNCSESYYGYPLPLPQTIAIIVAGTLLSIVTAGGNMMVVGAFKLERQLQTISNYFLFSLAMADLTIGLISIPLMTYYTAIGEWDLGYTTCQFWLSIDYLMSNASVMNLLLISFDRYFSVTRPLTYRPRRTSKKAMIMIAITFLISLILWPPLIIAWPYIEGQFAVADNECIVQFLRTNPAVTVVTATVAFYGPVVIMIVLYSRVYYVTKTRQRELIKLQAFNQQSLRRTVSANSESRIPLRNTLSTASSKIQHDSSAGHENESDLTTLYCNTNNNNNSLNTRSSPTARSISRSGLHRHESDSKWRLQSIFDHFTRPKPISSPSTRQASFASSGFEDEDSGSGVSGETTTCLATEEALPLRKRSRASRHSPSPSDYGSTLASHFINSVRQSFMIRKKSKVELASNQIANRFRSMSNPHPRHCKIVQMTNRGAYPNHYQQEQQSHLHPEVIENCTVDYNPANSPLLELKRMSAARKSPKSAGVTVSAPTPGLAGRLQATDEEDEEAEMDDQSRKTSRSGTPRSVSIPTAVPQESVYTVLIQLAKGDQAPPAPPRPRVDSGRPRGRKRPAITLYSADSYAPLSPDGATSIVSSCSTADVSSPGIPSVIVRRLSSSCSATSDPLSPTRARKPSQASCIASPGGLRRGQINRMSSGRSVGTNSVAGTSVIVPNSSTGRSTKRRRKGERKHQESKAARTLSAILLAFILTWAPYNVIVCIETFHANAVPVFWFTFSYYLCYLNSTINPLLYALCNATFRRAFWRIMTFRWAPVKTHHHKKPPHHQAAIAMTAVAIAASSKNQQQPFGTTTAIR